MDGTIHCVSFYAEGKLLAIGFNNQVLVVRQSSICRHGFNSSPLINRHPTAVWSNEKHVPLPPNTIRGEEDVTRSVHFHVKEKQLLVTYLYNGIMYVCLLITC